MKDMLELAAEKPNVDIERFADGEYVRVVTYSSESTVVSGLIHGVTFSLQVPGTIERDAIAALATRVTQAVRESVFRGAVALPGPAVRPVVYRSTTV